MKKLFLIALAIFTIACSNDEQPSNNQPYGVIRYERQIVNGERTSNTREVTNPNTACDEITETGTYQNTTYYWVVVCE